MSIEVKSFDHLKKQKTTLPNSREQSFINCGETMANVIKGKGVIAEEKARKTNTAFDERK